MLLPSAAVLLLASPRLCCALASSKSRMQPQAPLIERIDAEMEGPQAASMQGPQAASMQGPQAASMQGPLDPMPLDPAASGRGVGRGGLDQRSCVVIMLVTGQ